MLEAALQLAPDPKRAFSGAPVGQRASWGLEVSRG